MNENFPKNLACVDNCVNEEIRRQTKQNPEKFFEK